MDSPEDLIKRLTLDEKISLLSGKSMWSLQNIERVGVPSIRVSDGPQGLRKCVTELTAMESYPATCFPTSSALACSWNRSLAEQVGRAISKECRQQGVHVLLGPGLNLKRHPCGGRNFEYFSEDPVVSGHMAAAMVKGIQSSGHVGACIKHVCANNQESWRFRVNSLVDERTLRELYLSGFEYVIKNAHPWTLMTAYNQLNGIYCSENDYLFQNVVRSEWGYQGHVLTDWGATNSRVAGIDAGVDLEMPGSFGIHNTLIKDALKAGTLSQGRFDEAVLRNLQLIHRAVNGMQNGDNRGDNQLPSSQEQLYSEHHEIAYKAALDCVVLLQNNDNILPLASKQHQSSSGTKVTLIGDFCQFPRYQGMGSSKVNSTKEDTVLEHIGQHTDQYVFSRGYYNSDDESDRADNSHKQRKLLIEQAVNDSKDAEAIIIVAGVPESHESEGFDREHISLPTQHNELIQEVCKANSNVIVVLYNGGPVTMPWKDKVKGIVECYLPGQAGARALVEILFGMASPSGKLAESFPLSLNDVPSNRYFPGSSHTVEYREGLNVGYRYYDTARVPVLFPFGHGISYTTFAYENCTCRVIGQQQEEKCGTLPLVQVECTVVNNGSKPGSEIIQLYVHHNNTSTQNRVYHPDQQLQDFAKTEVLGPGQTEQVTFLLTADAFSFFDTGTLKFVMEEGATYEIRLGSSSRDIRWTGTIESADIAGNSTNSSVNIVDPSNDATTCHPPLKDKGSLASPLVVDDATFHDMLGTSPSELMHLSAQSLLQQHVPGRASPQVESVQGMDPNLQVLPHDIHVIHPNSFLSEVEKNGYLGKLFVTIIMKAAETQLEDPNDMNQRKVVQEVVMNTPLRCIATFSQGNMSFGALDLWISLFNGHYRTFIYGFFSSFSRK